MEIRRKRRRRKERRRKRRRVRDKEGGCDVGLYAFIRNEWDGVILLIKYLKIYERIKIKKNVFFVLVILIQNYIDDYINWNIDLINA